MTAHTPGLRAQVQNSVETLTGTVQEDDVDPLDAFMDAAVNPEVAAAEKAEAARKEAMRAEQVKALAVSTVVTPSSLHDSSTSCAAALTNVNIAASQVLDSWQVLCLF